MRTSARSSSTAAGSGAAGRRRYRLFGLTLDSDLALASRLEPGAGAADLKLTVSDTAPFAASLGEPLFSSPYKDESGRSVAHLYRLPEAELLRFDSALDFYLTGEAIHCHLRDPDCRHLIELRLLGPVLAYWLEQRSVCALHASAVVVRGQAIGFMAANRGGKSGLAAALMAAGEPLLSDDLLPVEAGGGNFTARPGYPQMRMWPDEAGFFLGGRQGLEPVHPRLEKLRVPVGEGGFGSFHEAAAPLACLYLPERRPAGESAGVEISPLSARRAVIELVRCSFSPFLVEAVGLQPGRLKLFSRLARQVAVRRLGYPSGFERLEEVRRAVVADLRALPAAGGEAG